jgi:hypothetical protein
MGQKWLTVHLDADTREALLAMARTDYRTPAQQLVWLARQEAALRGLLSIDVTSNVQHLEPREEVE